MQKVILDVDTGLDDALAIIYAVMSKKLKILGITTVAGNVNIDLATINTLKVLKLLGCSSIPVMKGCSAPLVRGIEFEEGVHGKDGLAGELEGMEPEYREQDHAVDFLIDQAEKYKDELVIVLLGPETNLAMALKKEPQIAGYIKEIILMGGVVDGPGNITPVAEFNIYKDPESAGIVFNSGIPITMIGLNLTRKAVLKREDLMELDRQRPVQDFVFKISEHYINKYSKCSAQEGVCALHDPLAVGVAIDNSLIKSAKKRVDVINDSIHCAGQTVCDHNNRGEKQLNVELGLELNYDSFLNSFMGVIKGL